MTVPSQVQQTVSVVGRPVGGDAEHYTRVLASQVVDVRLVGGRYICKQKRIRRERFRSLELSIA